MCAGGAKFVPGEENRCSGVVGAVDCFAKWWGVGYIYNTAPAVRRRSETEIRHSLAVLFHARGALTTHVLTTHRLSSSMFQSRLLPNVMSHLVDPFAAASLR